jgi:hypothetical protein
MPQQAKPTSTQYEGLLRQQLRATETLDGIFVVGPALTVAITTERLIVVGPTPPNGWGLKSIPWRLVTSMEPDPATAGSVRLRHEVTGKRTSGAWVSTPESGAGEQAGPPPGELLFVLPEDDGTLTALLDTRIKEAHQPQ